MQIVANFGWRFRNRYGALGIDMGAFSSDHAKALFDRDFSAPLHQTCYCSLESFLSLLTHKVDEAINFSIPLL
jgi:hypothetical protein